MIALLDGDDYWENNHLEIGCKNLCEHNVDFVYSNYLKVSNKIIKIKTTDINLIENKYDVLFDAPPQTNSFILKKEKIISKGNYFDENLRRHQDWKFLIDAISNGFNIKYIDEYTSYYCDSIRPLLSRVNYDSMLKFWCENKILFDRGQLEVYVINICVNCKLNKSYSEMYTLMNKYNFLFLIKKHNLFFRILHVVNNKYLTKFLYYLFFKRDLIFSKIIRGF